MLTATGTAAVLALALMGQARPDPSFLCPDGASNVELPGGAGARVLRCVDDTSGQPNGIEIWLGPNGFMSQRGRWEQGIRAGLWERWYPSGHLKTRMSFQQGAPVESTCLTELKRKPVACDAAFQPIDWAPPGSAPPGAAAPAAAPAVAAHPAAAPHAAPVVAAPPLSTAIPALPDPPPAP